MTLGDMIKELEQWDKSLVVKNGFGPPMSYRGYYDCVAFPKVANVTVREMLKHAKAALKDTFHGYKGGEYKFDENTPVFLAGYGECVDENDSEHDAWVRGLKYGALLRRLMNDETTLYRDDMCGLIGTLLNRIEALENKEDTCGHVSGT